MHWTAVLAGVCIHKRTPGSQGAVIVIGLHSWKGYLQPLVIQASGNIPRPSRNVAACTIGISKGRPSERASCLHGKSGNLRALGFLSAPTQQAVMGVILLLEDPLFRIYVLGQPAQGALNRPFKKEVSPFAACVSFPRVKSIVCRIVSIVHA